MRCKGSGGKKKKYMYYNCDHCRLYYREDEVEECLQRYIYEFVDYDMAVKKYFFPVLADKKADSTSKLEKEIENLQIQKERIKKAYLSGVVEMKDFSADYKQIEENIKMLETKRHDILELNKISFTPQQLMAERDIEREMHIRTDDLYDVLDEEWSKKSKEEKQEFISKFIEHVTLVRNERGELELDKMHFRSSFVEQMSKFLQAGIFDYYATVKENGTENNYKMNIKMTQKQLNDYLDRMNKKYDVKFYEAFNKDNMIGVEMSRQEKIIRLVTIEEDNPFPKKSNNNVRMGAIAYTPT